MQTTAYRGDCKVSSSLNKIECRRQRALTYLNMHCKLESLLYLQTMQREPIMLQRYVSLHSNVIRDGVP